MAYPTGLNQTPEARAAISASMRCNKELEPKLWEELYEEALERIQAAEAVNSLLASRMHAEPSAIA